MVGRDVDAIPRRMRKTCVEDEVVLKVEGLTRLPAFQNISFELKKGEILGFSGLVGSGRTEIMRAIFGADKKSGGDVYFKGKPVHIKNTTDALKLGIGLLPEDRKVQGFIKFFNNTDNIALSCLEKCLKFGLIDNNKKLINSEYFMSQLNVVPNRPDFLTQNMSGGNQQKVILAKWLSTDADILIFDEPTKGVDVATKAEIYRLMEEIVAKGKSIIMVSSELPEIMGICDRIIVMNEGKKMTELYPEQYDQEIILNYAMGGAEHVKTEGE
jgi:ribose transport system ATP-binding protein